MKYVYKLILRLAIALLLGTFLYPLYDYFFTPLTVWFSYLVLSIFNYNPVMMDNLVIIKNTLVTFIPACTAASAYFLLSLLVLLTKDLSFKKAISMFLLGSLLILFGNVVRAVILILILVNQGTNLFQTLHLFFWKVISGAYVALVWIGLIYLFKIKTIPVYSDLEILIKSIKKK